MTADKLPIQILLSSVLGHLAGAEFSFTSEAELQAGLAELFAHVGLDHQREVHLGPGDRLDFLVAGRLAVEVKIDGSVADLLRQLQRYAAHDEVEALLVVTTRSSLANLPPELQRKPVAAARLWTASL